MVPLFHSQGGSCGSIMKAFLVRHHHDHNRHFASCDHKLMAQGGLFDRVMKLKPRGKCFLLLFTPTIVPWDPYWKSWDSYYFLKSSVSIQKAYYVLSLALRGWGSTASLPDCFQISPYIDALQSDFYHFQRKKKGPFNMHHGFKFTLKNNYIYRWKHI